MNATIDERGVLIIAGDTMIEKMALTSWHEAWKEKRAGLRVEVLTPATHPIDLDPPATRPMDLDGG